MDQSIAAFTYWYHWCPLLDVTSITALPTITTVAALFAIDLLT